MCFHPAKETNRLLWVAAEEKPKGREGIQAIRIASCQVLATRQEAFQIGSRCQSRDAADTIVSKLLLYIFYVSAWHMSIFLVFRGDAVLSAQFDL